MQKIKDYLRLMRPANIVTAIADILGGIAIAGYFSTNDFQNIDWAPVLLLMLSTIGLYGGGIVLNDVFDAALDKVERPERPIPSGLISATSAAILGVALLLMGVIAAGFVHTNAFINISFLLAAAIAIMATVYDKWGKHQSFLGPVNMGLCRGLNLLLGISILPASLAQYYYLGIVPILYIAAITMISRGEVHGGRKSTLYGAVALYLIVVLFILITSYQRGNVLLALLFIVLFAIMIFRPLLKAIQQPIGPRIGKAVKWGVIALILMNAAWAASFGAVYVALVILLLLPLSLLLARLFAVT